MEKCHRAAVRRQDRDRGSGSAGWERRPGGSSGVGVCTAGDGREVPELLLPRCFQQQLPLTLCPRLCCLELSQPGAASLSPRLLPVSAHSPHPTRCVLSLALQTPPGSRALPRGISVCAGAQERLRQVLTRPGVLVLKCSGLDNNPKPELTYR